MRVITLLCGGVQTSVSRRVHNGSPWVVVSDLSSVSTSRPHVLTLCELQRERPGERLQVAC